MASPVLHIKDAYYFEVPKFLWPSNREGKADFPEVWVRLDEKFQLWEAKQLHRKLSKIADGVPAEDELLEQYKDWKKHDHANFAKPLDVMLEKRASESRQTYEKLIKAGELDAETTTFKQYLEKRASESRQEYDKLVSSGELDADTTSFKQYLEKSDDEADTQFAWFSQHVGDETFDQEWQTAKDEAGDVTQFAAVTDEEYAWTPKDIKDYNHHLSGKILIPQPLGELRNLYEPESGFCISKFMVIQVFVALIMFFVFWRLGKKLASGGAPRGRIANMLEAFLVYLRDHVARPAIGEHDADRFVPLLWTFFMFVLGCNLCGMLPWVGAPTGSFGVTTGLALVTLATGMVCGMRKFGPLGYFTNQVPSMDLPLILAIPIKPMILVIEVVGLGIRHAVLAIRLLANMVAGHLVLLGIMGLAFGAAAALSFAGAPDWTWWLTATISIVASTMFSLLELLVAFLQAYIFTFLSALFIGAVIHHH